MANNSRDEVVRFIYEVTGDEELAASAAAMLKAGDAADTTTAEFDKFSKALKDAAAQSRLIQTALSQKSGLADLKTQLAEAQEGLDKLRASFDQTDTSNRKVTKAFNDAESAVASLTSKITAQSVALQKTEGALAKAGVDTNDLAGAYAKVTAQGNAAANALARTAVEAKQTASTGESAATGVEKLHQVLLAIGAFVGLEKLKDGLLEVIKTGEDFADLRKQFATAFGGIDAGAKSLEAVKTIAASVPQSLEDVSAAAIALKRAGFDPLDGSLQAVLDNANALNQSQDQLITTITALGKPMFREAFKRRRCLVPARGYFEWKGEDKAKQPYFIHSPHAQLLLFAGLWESWRESKEAAPVYTYTIVTGPPGIVSGDIHDRAPAILPSGAWNDWLTGEPDQAAEILASVKEPLMEYYPVPKAVGSPKNDVPELVEPIT